MKLLCTMLLACVCAFAQSKTTITDTLYDGTGGKLSTDLEITWPSMKTPDGYTVLAGRTKYRVAQGTVSLALFPNAGATPAPGTLTPTVYTVRYHQPGGPQTEYWSVPASGPVTVDEIRVAPPSALQISCDQMPALTGAVTSTVNTCATAITALPQSSVANLVSDLAAKAADNAVVKLTGDQNVAGVKTFTGSGLVTASGAKTADFAALDISNAATSSTASVTKIGLSLSSTGTWNGSGARNIALNIAPASGATGYLNKNIHSGPPASSFGFYESTVLEESQNFFGLKDTPLGSLALGVVNSSTVNTASLFGAVFNANSHVSSGTLATATALKAEAKQIEAGGTVTNLSAAALSTFSVAGSIDTARALWVQSPSHSATVTTNVGVDIGNQAVAGASNFALRTGTGLVQFGDRVSLTPQAFSALTACAAGLEGSVQPVNDSTTAVWGETVTGGGANKVLAYCNGTNWTVAAK